MKRELSYIQFCMDQSQWSTATTDLTRLKHMVLISACHGPFYSYTRPPLTPPRTPSSVLTGCRPSKLMISRCSPGLGARHAGLVCKPPASRLRFCHVLRRLLLSFHCVFEWFMNDIFVTQCSLHGWLTDAWSWWDIAHLTGSWKVTG